MTSGEEFFKVYESDSSVESIVQSNLWVAYLSQVFYVGCMRDTLVYSLSFSLSRWDMFRCGSKNGHQTYLCVNEIGLRRAPNMLIVMGLIVNMIGRGLYDYSMSTGNFTLITSQGR